jgi:F420-non-reducing hydrogenase large subunit
MGKKIVIQPVTRLEGHAKVVIQLDDAGNVADTTFNTVELRGFEKFCIGRPVEELPRITTSICGVCPWSHHLASAKTNDAIFGVEIPSAGKKLRRLCNSIAFCEEHILHFFFLSAADFIMGPDADYAVRNVIGIAQANPEIGRKVVRSRHLGCQMLEIASGKAIHPVTAVPGGFSKPLTQAERDKMLPLAEELLEFAKFAISFTKENVFSKYLDTVNSLGVIKTGFLGTVTDDGTLDLYDGKLRLMKPDGSFVDFAYDQYLDYIEEKVLEWTYMKAPYAKSWEEGFSMDINNPEEFRSKFGRPAQQTLLYHWARLIELLYNAELIVELLNDPEITSRETRVPVTPRAAHAVGCVEAPRGTLIHDYETDENGIVTNCNLIVGTTHNNAPINMSVNQSAKSLIKNGKYDQGMLNRIEMSIRAYDPCLSCATHNLDGSIAVQVDILDSEGNLINSLKN